MRAKSFLLLALSALLSASVLAGQESTLIESVRTGCQKEIGEHCNAITPGEGRVLSCLYANDDKLSARCEYALYDASAQLERAVAALSYVNSECDKDMQANCAAIKPGEGRLLQCLKKNEGKVSERCKTALQDVKQR